MECFFSLARPSFLTAVSDLYFNHTHTLLPPNCWEEAADFMRCPVFVSLSSPCRFSQSWIEPGKSKTNFWEDVADYEMSNFGVTKLTM